MDLLRKSDFDPLFKSSNFRFCSIFKVRRFEVRTWTKIGNSNYWNVGHVIINFEGNPTRENGLFQTLFGPKKGHYGSVFEIILGRYLCTFKIFIVNFLFHFSNGKNKTEHRENHSWILLLRAVTERLEEYVTGISRTSWMSCNGRLAWWTNAMRWISRRMMNIRVVRGVGSLGTLPSKSCLIISLRSLVWKILSSTQIVWEWNGDVLEPVHPDLTIHCIVITSKVCKDFPRESANTFAPKFC